MNTLVFQVLTVLVAASSPAASENTLLDELVKKGVAMPDGQVIPLRAPMMAEDLDAAGQAEVLAKVAALGNTTVEKILDEQSNAAITLKTGKYASQKNGDIIRTVNLYFVVRGDWEVLTGKQFVKGILKAGKAKNSEKGEGLVSRAGYIEAPDLAVRGLATRSTPKLKEFYLYTTLKLFDQVELSTTRFGMATTTPSGVIVAARVDPRFAKDKQYPNQWRSITKNPLGVPVLGPPEPYFGAAFYAKVTRLITPADAIFVEFHQVFYEPQAWFGAGAGNLMPSQMRQIIPFEVKEFRNRLARATQDAAEKAKAETK